MSEARSNGAIQTIDGGRPATFEEVVGRYAGPLVRFFRRRLADVQSAENLVQETFYRVFRYGGSYRAERSFSSWIYAIAANLHRDWLKEETRQPRLVAEPAAGIAQSRRDANPEAEACDREVDRYLLEVLAGIPRRHRDVFVLKHRYGLTYAEVGTALGISEGTVKSRMHKVTRLIAERMARRGFERFDRGEDR